MFQPPAIRKYKSFTARCLNPTERSETFPLFPHPRTRTLRRSETRINPASYVSDNALDLGIIFCGFAVAL
jgi:hypothetical protein